MNERRDTQEHRALTPADALREQTEESSITAELTAAVVGVLIARRWLSETVLMHDFVGIWDGIKEVVAEKVLEIDIIALKRLQTTHADLDR